MQKRVHSFIWGGISALAFISLGISTFVNTSDIVNLVLWAVIGVMSFTFISCLILGNNFIGEMVLDILSWGFVKTPGLIFTLDLDGIIWLLTVKLLFWVLGIVLACICGLFGVILGAILSVFVYPYAIYKNVKYPMAD